MSLSLDLLHVEPDGKPEKRTAHTCRRKAMGVGCYFDYER